MNVIPQSVYACLQKKQTNTYWQWPKDHIDVITILKLYRVIYWKSHCPCGRLFLNLLPGVCGRVPATVGGTGRMLPSAPYLRPGFTVTMYFATRHIFCKINFYAVTNALLKKNKQKEPVRALLYCLQEYTTKAGLRIPGMILVAPSVFPLAQKATKFTLAVTTD